MSSGPSFSELQPNIINIVASEDLSDDPKAKDSSDDDDEIKPLPVVEAIELISAEQSVLGYFSERVDIVADCKDSSKETVNKRKNESENCSVTKRLKFSDGNSINNFSREDFNSDVAWDKFVRYREGDPQEVFSCSRNGRSRRGISTHSHTEDSIKEESEKGSLKICRICLATGCKMYLMSKYELSVAYQHLTGLHIKEEDKLPKTLCVECSYRLTNCNKFRSKCLRANSLLLEVLSSNDRLTHKSLTLQDRHKNQLTSNLTTHLTGYNNFDETIEHIVKIKKEEDAEAEDNYVQIEVNIKKDYDERSIEDERDIFINQVTVIPEADILCGDNTDNSDYHSDEPISTCLKRLSSTKTVKRKKINSVVSEKKRKSVRKKVKCKRGGGKKESAGNAGFNEKFTVTDLSFEEQVAALLKRKETSNYKMANSQCDKCFKGFVNKKAFETHMSKHSDACGTFECQICKLHFKSKRHLTKHLDRHKQMYSCNVCDYKNTHRTSAMRHYSWHKGTQYACPHCPEVFQKHTTYFSHLRLKHPSDFICQLCGHSFVSQKGVDKHKSLSHELDGNQQIPDDGPYCDSCNIRFMSAEAYNTHLQVSAKHASPHEGKTKRNDYNQGKRKRINKTTEGRSEEIKRKTVSPITCEQCGEELPNSRAYYHHFRMQHPGLNRTRTVMLKPSMCEVCGKVFSCRAFLKDHSLVHTGHRFKCDICDKVVTSKQGLSQHKMLHLPTKPRAQCTVCGKYFSNIPNMKRHMFIHTGLKPFSCDMCEKAFATKNEKKLHITYVHLKKPWPKRERGKGRATRTVTPQGDDDDVKRE